VPVVLKVWSSNPYNNGGCDFAVVDLTPGFAKVALRRIAVLCQEKALDPSVYETYYWDSAAEYFSPWVIAPASRKMSRRLVSSWR
jgi:hypothetical protein